jgi:hypothetical protein
VRYESDTSGEQSDHEIATDVTSILQSTEEMRSPSKGLMMTTIQRLAAQLQNTKPLETNSLPESEPVTAQVPEQLVIKKERISPKKHAEDMAVILPASVKMEVKDEPSSPGVNILIFCIQSSCFSRCFLLYTYYCPLKLFQLLIVEKEVGVR